MPDSKNCPHPEGAVVARFNRIAEKEGGPVKAFMLDVEVRCAACHLPFQFVGLPLGLNMAGAAMNVDGTEARLAIAPVGSVPQPMDGFLRFGIRGPGAKLDG